MNRTKTIYKNAIYAIIFLLFPRATFAQNREMDSLKQLLSRTSSGTARVDLLVKLGLFEQSFKGGLRYAEDALALAKKIHYRKGEGASFNQIGNQYFAASNYPAALNFYFQGLKIREETDDINGIFGSYNNIANVYFELGDLDRALTYNFKSLQFSQPSNVYGKACLLNNVGTIYEKREQLDSALYYQQRSYELFNQSMSKYQYINTLNALGSLQMKLGNYELAKSYFSLGIKNGVEYNDSLNRASSYLGLAKLFKQLKQEDSCINYAKRAIVFAHRQQSVAQSVIVDAGKLVSELYVGKNDKEAYTYLKLAMDTRDSTFSREKTMQIQNMVFAEQERQKEIQEQKSKEAEERQNNLQYAAIALGLVTLLIGFFVLSHSVIANQKLIKFLGIVSLLIIFEFLNLLLHPYLGELTHHSPVWMLLVMVSVAALLVPLHHKVEYWVTHKLVEKNNRIRLVAAKKTVAKLEGKVS
ncbi:tetratricopeptide repeat protein [Flavisolibacter ginsengisoli]|uniref:Tetratricopeptide repeat-containing protein n=1 Tax=Flavisolibacter ginsengisoli DSM 18119 TaxID=1121884 RepID=A0A1M4VML7_9BACT|nr:tetratricopeptide repeat protein [Flavisolibacter ginsengisoli]SHE70148.1 Tetratricopeptide repeat-containing protein [Flavisolibacter ginsengisoli DSM 18119]